MTTSALDRRQQRAMALAERDPQLARLIPRKSAQAAAEQATDSLAQLIATLLRVYAERPALGQRAYEIGRAHV